MSRGSGKRGRGFDVGCRSVCFRCDFPRFNNDGNISLIEVGGKERIVISGGARMTGDGGVLDELITHYENNNGVDLESFLAMWEIDGIKFVVTVVPEACKHVCGCLCHTSGAIHVMACCRSCNICGKNIKILKIVEHMDECHEGDATDGEE